MLAGETFPPPSASIFNRASEITSIMSPVCDHALLSASSSEAPSPRMQKSSKPDFVGIIVPSRLLYVDIPCFAAELID